MKTLNFAVATTVIALSLTPVSCTWFQTNPVTPVNTNDAISKAQSYVTTAKSVVSNATLAWNFMKGFIPADKLASVEVDFKKSIASANEAITILNDVINAAVAVNNQNPDFNKAYASVSDAVQRVLSVVNTWAASVPAPSGAKPGTPAASPIPGLVEARSGAETLKLSTK